MATSPAPTFCTQRGVPFIPTNGVAVRTRNDEIDAQIAEAQRQAAEEARKFTRTRKTNKVWGS